MTQSFGSREKRLEMNEEVPNDPIQLSDEAHVVIESQETTKSVEDVAREVIAGKWGRGHIRQQRLRDAGYDPAAVKAEVDRIFGRA